MAFYVADGSEPDPDDAPLDPTRERYARMVRDLAYFLEMDTQAWEAYDDQVAALKARCGQLEATVRQLAGTVTLLEQLVIGEAAA